MKQRSFPLSEGIRGMAALAIVVVHVWLVTQTYSEDLAARLVIRLDVCVSLFFMLSAFLLYRPMIAHRSGAPRGPGVVAYARRRFFRIFPVYWVALTCLAIVPGLAGVFSDQWWAFYSLWFNYDPQLFVQDCIGSDELCGLPQTWTLATELTFYALLPLYAFVAARLLAAARGRVAVEVLLIAALIAASVLVNVLPGDLREEPWVRFTLIGHFDWLGLGLLLAVASVAWERRPSLPRIVTLLAERPGISFGLAFALYLLMAFTLPPIPFPLTPDLGDYMAMHLGHAAMATLIMIPVVFGNPNVGRSRKFLGHPVVVWLGLISYGMYLWHFSIAYNAGVGGADETFWPVLAVTLGLAIPLGAISWYAIERPMMRLKYRRRPKREPA